MTERTEWVVWPIRERFLSGIATSAVIFLVSFSIGSASSAAAGVAVGLLLVLSLRRFFLPTRYVVDEHGIAVRCLGSERRRPWVRLRRFRYDDAGAFLST